MDLPPYEVELREVPDLRMPLLQIALLRRSMDRNAETCERCARCDRTPLSGEQTFVGDSGRMVCELCVDLEPDTPREGRLVHGPEFGRTIRVVDQRIRAKARFRRSTK
jgi:hypothetical protein